VTVGRTAERRARRPRPSDVTAVRRRAPVAGLLAAGLLLAGCGTAGGPPGTGSPGMTKLSVTARVSPTAPAQTWTLTCDPPGGSHPNPAAACAALAATADPFSATPPDRACTMIYGGAQTATIVGTYRGLSVNASYSRTNGCEIARWDTVAAVLVIPGGA
jgi:hypothetical protein